MSHDRTATFNRLDALLADTSTPELPLAGRYAVISDLHLGNGGPADDFRRNRLALEAALDAYERDEYTLLLLGDVEELWQFDIDEVTTEYRDVYRRLRGLGRDHVVRVFGNHDAIWGSPSDPIRRGRRRGAAEAIKLVDRHGKARVLLVHGHQGSLESDKNSWLSRAAVRLFRSVEPIAAALRLYDHPSATMSRIPTDYERIFHSWAEEHRMIVIGGHSHRAIFASRSHAETLSTGIAELWQALNGASTPEHKRRLAREIKRLEHDLGDEQRKGRDIIVSNDPEPLPCYFNSGCGIYSDGMTALEIDGDEIRLVKWDTHEGRRDPAFHANRASLGRYLHRMDQHPLTP